MPSQRWKTGVMLSLLASATCLAVACGGSSSSGGYEHGVDASAADVGAPDASTSEDAPTSDAPDADTCFRGIPPNGFAGTGPLNLTFDQEIAYLCSESDAGGFQVSRGTMECDGLLALVERLGVDEMYVYLFDATTRDVVEVLEGVDCIDPGCANYCLASVTGVDLRPAFNGCQGLGWQVVCGDGAPTVPSDSGPPDAPSDAPFDVPFIDASSE